MEANELCQTMCDISGLRRIFSIYLVFVGLALVYFCKPLVLGYFVQFLPGAIENSIYISLGLIFLADMHTVSRKQEGLNASRHPAGMAGSLLLGGLLTAFQLLPSYEMLKYSVRAEVKADQESPGVGFKSTGHPEPRVSLVCRTGKYLFRRR